MSHEARRILLLFKRDLRRELWRWSRHCGVSFKALQQLDDLYRDDQTALAIVLCLLKTKTFKSDFRQSLASQVRQWCDTLQVAQTRKYPLTEKQLRCCKGKGEQHTVRELPRQVAQARHCKRINPLSN